MYLMGFQMERLMSLLNHHILDMSKFAYLFSRTLQIKQHLPIGHDGSFPFLSLELAPDLHHNPEAWQSDCYGNTSDPYN